MINKNKNINIIQNEKKFKLPKFKTQGNKYISSKSKIINKIPTIKNWILKTEWPSPKGSNPHSYGDNFSNATSLSESKKAIPNKSSVSIKLLTIYKSK